MDVLGPPRRQRRASLLRLRREPRAGVRRDLLRPERQRRLGRCRRLCAACHRQLQAQRSHAAERADLERLQARRHQRSAEPPALCAEIGAAQAWSRNRDRLHRSARPRNCRPAGPRDRAGHALRTVTSSLTTRPKPSAAEVEAETR